MIIQLPEFFERRKSLPVVDVRSESEFSEGHVPGAINIPILRDEERVAVGTDYKQKGQLEAIKTGFRLAGPRIIDLVNEAELVARNGELIVHCWRGGMRSGNFSQFLRMAQMRPLQLEGGYKAYRQEAITSFGAPFKFIVIGGSTGSGKSELLRALKNAGEQVLDLELLASHRGSVFGGLMMPPQPTTEQFQNDLFEEILKLDLTKRIWIEDESIAVGKIFLPEPLWRTMNNSPIIEVIVNKNIRVERLVAEYGDADREEFLLKMEQITKKLGGQLFNEAKDALYRDDMATTIDLLLHYYDKAYATGLSKKQERIKQQVRWDGGDSTAIVETLRSSSLHQYH